MRKLILKMDLSLDGFVAGPNDDMSWMQFDDDEQWDVLFEMLEHVDLFLLGAGMWHEYRDHWKNVLKNGGPKNEVRYAEFAERTPHIVFSSSLKNAGWENTTIESGDLKTTVERLKAQPGKDIQIVGGARFGASMIDTGLVDEYYLMINPVIVGKGKSFFHHLNTRHNLERTDVRVLKSGIVLLRYNQLDSTDANDIVPRKRRQS